MSRRVATMICRSVMNDESTLAEVRMMAANVSGVAGSAQDGASTLVKGNRSARSKLTTRRKMASVRVCGQRRQLRRAGRA